MHSQSECLFVTVIAEQDSCLSAGNTDRGVRQASGMVLQRQEMQKD